MRPRGGYQRGISRHYPSGVALKAIDFHLGAGTPHEYENVMSRGAILNMATNACI